MERPRRAARSIAYTEQVSDDEESENEASTHSSENSASANSVYEDSEVGNCIVSFQPDLTSLRRMNPKSFRIPKS
jgi:hypothetical protein